MEGRTPWHSSGCDSSETTSRSAQASWWSSSSPWPSRPHLRALGDPPRSARHQPGILTSGASGVPAGWSRAEMAWFGVDGRRCCCCFITRPVLHTNLQTSLKPTASRKFQLNRPNPCRRIPPNCSAAQYVQFITALHTEFDIVVVDSPPVLAVADAAILSALSDGVLLMIGHRPHGTILQARAVENLQQAGASACSA